MNEQAATIDYEYWNLVINIGKVVFTIIVAILAAWLGHRYWKKQKEIENQLKRQEMQYESRAQSSKAIWSLLEYLSEQEYPKTIIVNRGTSEKIDTYLRLDRAKQFIQDIPKILYTDGHGAFVTSGVEDKIMSLRAKFYGFIESTLRKEENKQAVLELDTFHSLEGFYKLIDDQEQKMVKIKNPNFVKDVREKTDYLRQYLQNQLKGDLR